MTNHFFEPLGGNGDLSLAAITFRVFFALCVGGVLGIERGLRNRPAGFMTYMLVTIGSTIFMLTNQYIYQVFGTGDPVYPANGAERRYD